MGVEPFLVSSSLLMIVAQRLVRRLCMDCREAYNPSDVELRDVGLMRSAITKPIYRATGCKSCLDTGYKGRTGIYEMLSVTDSVRQLVMQSSDSGAVRKAAIADGMNTLRQDGLLKVIAGFTSFDEVIRVTQEEA
jgi:general secretion pathway protein E